LRIGEHREGAQDAAWPPPPLQDSAGRRTPSDRRARPFRLGRSSAAGVRKMEGIWLAGVAGGPLRAPEPSYD